MKAMLLAAGRGERMRPLTDHTPKPLLQAGGKPLIAWHIERLAKAGFRELVINHAHLGEQIPRALGDGSQWGVKIEYSDEGTALETAGGIAYALHLLGDTPFAVVNGDIYCEYDFSALPRHAATMQQQGDNCHLVLVNNPTHNAKGDFSLQGKCVVPNSPQAPLLTFSGIGIYQPAMFRNIPRGCKAPLAPFLREQIAAGKVSGEHYTGTWIDVGTPERLQQLDNTLMSKHN